MVFLRKRVLFEYYKTSERHRQQVNFKLFVEETGIVGAIPTIIDIILLYSQVDKAPVKNFLVFCEVNMPKWSNWQPRQTQNLFPQGVRVRVPSWVLVIDL